MTTLYSLISRYGVKHFAVLLDQNSTLEKL